MQKRAARKSGRGGRALLTGIARCGRCGRMLHVFYGMAAGHAHRYQCRGDVMRGADRCCVGIGGVRVDRAVSTELLRAVAPHAVEPALEAAERASRAVEDVLGAVRGELEEARYETALAGRRHAAVDPDKRKRPACPGSRPQRYAALGGVTADFGEDQTERREGDLADRGMTPRALVVWSWSVWLVWGGKQRR